jgi:hypothetical protein
MPSGRRQGFSLVAIGIRRVIYDVNLKPKLAETAPGRVVIRHLAFNKQKAWARHDQHYRSGIANALSMSTCGEQSGGTVTRSQIPRPR